MSHKTNDSLKKISDWNNNNPRNTLDNKPELPNKPTDNTQSAINYERQPENVVVVVTDGRPLTYHDMEKEKDFEKKGNRILKDIDPKY